MTIETGQEETPASPANSWYLETLQEGIASAEAGKLTDLATVKAQWENRAAMNAVNRTSPAAARPKRS